MIIDGGCSHAGLAALGERDRAYKSIQAGRLLASPASGRRAGRTGYNYARPGVLGSMRVRSPRLHLLGVRSVAEHEDTLGAL